MLLIGEPGLGKSRLVHTMKQLVREQAGAASSSDPAMTLPRPAAPTRRSSNGAARGAFRIRVSIRRPSSSSGFWAWGWKRRRPLRFERLVRHLRDYDLARSDFVPLFATLLSLSADERFPPLGLSPVREREETFRALVEWLRAYSGRRPILFVVEDLHWADASTLEFLQQLFAEGLHDRILTVVTFRPEFQPPWPAAAHQTSLALTCLTQRQVADLMGKKTGSVVPEALAEQVFGRTGGVPLFVEEYTRMLQESAIVESADGRRSAAPGRTAARDPLLASGPDHGKAGSKGG